uniref:Fibronectin type-III domain-containing protein n=1 Tax=Naja naja TaxID=35670 RepID=A0A8C7DZ45_NAJNA
MKYTGKNSPTFKDISATVTSNSAHLSWTVSSGDFDSFLIQYKDAEGRLQELFTEGDSHEITIPNLAPSHRYTIDLYGISNQERLGPASITFDTDASEKEMATIFSPTGPQEDVSIHKTVLRDLAVSEVTSNSAHLTWRVPSGRFDFLLQYRDSEGYDQALRMDGDSREIMIPNLVPSQRYRFNLYGILGTQRLGPLFADAVTGQDPNTPRPTYLYLLGEFSILDVTSDTIRLYWTYKDADGQPQALPVEGGSREVTVTNLVPSRRYKFNLYGVSGRKRSSPLSTDATTTAQTIEPEVSASFQSTLGELSVLDATSNSVRLHWTVSTGSFDSFLIQYKDADGQPQALPVEGDSREVMVTNLVPSRRYKFNLYGVSGRKRSSPISTFATTAAGKPRHTDSEKQFPVQPSLGEFSALDIRSDSVRLRWTISTGSFESFLIQYKDADGQPQALPVEGGSNEVIVNNLVPSHRYKFNLYGVSGKKRSRPLATEATTGQLQVLPIPVQPSLGEFSVLDVTNGQPQALPAEGSSREVTVTNLAPSRRYKFNLYGVFGSKRSSPLSTDAITGQLEDLAWLIPSGDSKKPVPIQPSLGELSVFDVTSNSVRLYWTIPTGSFDSFLIQYNNADGQPQALPIDGGSNQVTVANLAPSHRYKFNLYGVSGHKRSNPLSIDATTGQLDKLAWLKASRVTHIEEPIPVQPSLGEFSIHDVTNDSVRLHWTVPTGRFDSFLIQYKDADGQPQALPVEGGSREVTVTNLVPSRRYKFNLYGVSGRKRSSPLSTDATTARFTHSVETNPVQPSLGEFSALDITSDSVRLYWTVPTGRFDSFLIQYKDADGQPQTMPVEGGFNEVTVTNLTPSQRYKFNLYGISGRKRSSPLSTDATTDPNEAIPVQPSLGDFTVLDVTSDTIRLYWTVPTGSFDSFLIQYKDADGQPQALPVEGGSREVMVTNLVPSRRYKFNLYGVFGRKRSSPLSTDATTGHLGEFSVLDVTSDSVHLHWTVPTGNFDSFLVQYKDADGQPQALPVEGGSNEVIVSNLVPSRRYKFNLYGISGRKRSSPLSTDATTVSKEPIGVQPSLGEFSVLDVTSDSVRLHWTVPTGSFDSFLIQYKDADGQPQALPVEGGSNEVTVTNLVPSRKYKFNLYGVSGRKRSRPLITEATTGQLHVAPVATTSIQPSLGEFSVLDFTSDSVRLYWTVPTGNFDSFLIQYKDADGQPQALPVEGGSNEVTVTNLVPSHRYKFNLYGVSGRKRSSPLSTEATTGQLRESTYLGEFSVLDVTSDSVRLHWTVPTGTFDSFLIQYKDADGQPQALPVEGGSTEVTVSNLVPSRRYKFNLYGISGHERSGPLSTDFSVVDVTMDSVRLHWTVPTGRFDSFLVQYKDADGQPQALPVEGGSNEVTVTSLTPSHRYKFNLYGVFGRKRSNPLSTDATTGQFQESEWPGLFSSCTFILTSCTLTLTFLRKNPVQPSLGEFSALDITSDSVRLHWTVPTGSFDSFVIQYKDGDGQPQALPVEGGIREVTVTNLAPSRRYKFNLYGVFGRKRSSPLSTDATTGQLQYLAWLNTFQILFFQINIPDFLNKLTAY